MCMYLYVSAYSGCALGPAGGKGHPRFGLKPLTRATPVFVGKSEDDVNLY
jgi:hypothetical protein